MPTEFIAPNLSLALPEIFVMLMACFILVIDVFLSQQQRHITYSLSQLTLLGALLITISDYDNTSLIGFDGHYIKDNLSDILKVVVYIVSATVFLYSRDYLRDRSLFKGEYYILSLFGVLGMMVMISSASFLSLYLGLELLSLCQYSLVAFNRDSANASEAAMKYFVLGALASGMLLYGISMIYGASGGHLDFQTIAQQMLQTGTDDLLLVFGLAFLVVGLAFKLGAVPFHMWLPDVYQGAPTSVTLFIGAAPKLAAFAIVIRVLTYGLESLHNDWQQMLIILAALSIVTGNLIAIAQINIKRMLAYSTISHVGFLLLGILAGTPEGYTAALFYTITYVLMVTGAFGVILILSRHGFEAEHITDFKGLNDKSPWLALMMLLIMMSMAGIPFLVGFYAKLMVLQAIISEGLIWLAIISVVFSVVGAFYYLRVVKYMYFDRAEDGHSLITTTGLDMQIVISINGLLIILLGIYPTALMSLCAGAFTI